MREALKRWKDLPRDEKLSTPLWSWLLGDGTPVYKLPGAALEYTSKSEFAARTCGNCRFAYQKVATGKYICSVIRGPIAPAGWCQMWDGVERS